MVGFHRAPGLEFRRGASAAGVMIGGVPAFRPIGGRVRPQPFEKWVPIALQIQGIARPEGLEPPSTWFQVTATNLIFQREQSLATLAALIKPR